MNRLTLLTFLLLFTCGLSMNSCLEEESDKNRDKVTYIEITVAAKTVEEEYYPLLSGTSFLREFLQVKTKEDTRWSRMGLQEIAGFTYKDGWEYQLKVKKRNWLILLWMLLPSLTNW
ncbi:MAG: DUF4377 domain-containing protein [Bacteroides sp.]|nr:DUF4377 domain-containing protein [Bacteroides sp.]